MAQSFFNVLLFGAFMLFSTETYAIPSRIQINYSDLKKGDSVLVTAFKFGYFSRASRTDTWLISDKGYAECTIEHPKEVDYILVQIAIPGLQFMFTESNIIMFPGDELSFDIGVGKFKLLGKDSAFFQTQYDIFRTLKFSNSEFDYNNPKLKLRDIDLARDSHIKVINARRDVIGEKRANALVVNEIISAEFDKPSFIFDEAPGSNYHGHNRKFYVDAYNKYLETEHQSKKLLERIIKDGSITKSLAYPYYVTQKFALDRKFYSGWSEAASQMGRYAIAEYFSKKTRGLLRDIVLLELLKGSRYHGDSNFYNIVDIALKNVKHPDLYRKVLEIRKLNGVGTQLATFSFEDTAGKIWTNDDLKGKVFLMDFWWSGCGACRENKPIIDSIKSLFKGQPFEVLSVSSSNRESWMESIRGIYYTSPDNINVYTKGKGIYDPFWLTYNILAAPTFMLVDRNGTLLSPVGMPLQDRGVRLVQQIKKALNN